MNKHESRIEFQPSANSAAYYAGVTALGVLGGEVISETFGIVALGHKLGEGQPVTTAGCLIGSLGVTAFKLWQNRRS